MRAVLQRVQQADVSVAGRLVSRIDGGLLVYASIARGDTEADAEFVARKIAGCRVFADTSGRMNLSLREVGGSVLLVSNFTLHGDLRKGRRPSFEVAASPQDAERLYSRLVSMLAGCGVDVQTGVFGAHMHVHSVNDGPVTFILESGV